MPLVHHDLCFGCGQANLFGLQAELERRDDGSVAGRVFVKQDHQGPPCYAHGGILAAALDEAIASGGTGTREARQAAAAGHSWDVRSSALEAWLRDLVADGAPAKTMQHVLYPGI